MLWLGLGVLVVIAVLAPVLITQGRSRVSSSPSPSISPPSPEAKAETEEAQRCVMAWTAGDQRNFSCEACVGPMRTLPNDFVHNGTAGVGAALQYCALMDVWDAVEEDEGLAGWGESQSPCRWAGVGCDTRGRVTSLELRAPAMPRSMPELSGLVVLQTLRLRSDGSAPTGILNVTGLQSLTLLSAEYTMLQGLLVAENISTVVLVHNPHLPMTDLSGTRVTTL